MGSFRFLRGGGGRLRAALRGAARGLGIRRGLRVARRLGFALGGPRLALFPVVGDVEPAPLEDQPRAATHQPLQGRPAAFRAFLQGLVPHGLELLEMVAALWAFVLVGGHRWWTAPVWATPWPLASLFSAGAAQFRSLC